MKDVMQKTVGGVQKQLDKQRVNNPPVGLVNPDTDPYAGVKKGYAYDPHLDPQLGIPSGRPKKP
jgi:hypothetical protein